MPRARHALVESVPLVLTPKLLRVPRSPDHSAVLLWPSVPAQLRFQVTLAGDGIPVRITIRRQPLTFSPPRWVPEQTVRLLSTFIHHPSGLRRRYWFRCPSRSCHRRVASLILFPDHLTRSRSRFLCRSCLRAAFPNCLPRPSDSIHQLTYLAARDPFNLSSSSPRLTLRRQLRAIPVWLRWQTEGRKGKGRGLEAKWEAVPVAASDG